jgi:hypothetical protein
MQYQPLVIENCVTAFQNESNNMSLDEKVQIVEVMDQIRSLTGIEYSGA